MEKRLVQLSKQVSHALRHEPWLYELKLDSGGWVSIKELLTALCTLKQEWSDLVELDLVTMIEQSSKKRHEIKNGKIRVLYGHSTPYKLLKEAANPPGTLYHGTSPEVISYIMKEGLKPMGRHYVHLSLDRNTANQVGKRKCSEPVILIVNSKAAHQQGICFYRGNEQVWLADYISSVFLKLD